jgi:hypothetical protein
MKNFYYEILRYNSFKNAKLKLVEAKDVRWLFYDQATTTLRKCLPIIYTSLEREAEERNDARAAGLSVFTQDYRFILAIHMMCDVLPHLTAFRAMHSLFFINKYKFSILLL